MVCNKPKLQDHIMSTDNNEILALRDDVVVTTLEREAVLLDLETKYFYSVNPSGWAITQLFENGATRTGALEQSTAWAEDTAAVAAFIERLVAERLITSGNGIVPGGSVVFDGQWSSPTIEKHREPLQRVMVSAFDPTLPLAE